MAREAGRQAEADLVAALRNLEGVAPRQVFAAVRVPLWTPGTDSPPDNRAQARPARRGANSAPDEFAWVDTPATTASRLRLRRGEIDVVVVTLRGVFALEIKNWSGTVDVDPSTNRWRQTRARTGEVVDHGDLTGCLDRKVAGLLEHAARHGVALPESAVQSKIVFTNKNCRFTDLARTVDGAVFPEQVAEFVSSFQRSVTGHFADVTLPRWFSGCSVGLSLVVELCAIVESTCRTWDILTLSDGTVLDGDFTAVTDSQSGQRRTLGDVGLQREMIDRLDFTEREAVSDSPLSRLRDDMLATAADVWGWLGGDMTGKEAPKKIVAVAPHRRPEAYQLRAIDLALHPILGDSLPTTAADPNSRSPLTWVLDHGPVEWLQGANALPVITLDALTDGILFHRPGEPDPQFYLARTVSTVHLSIHQ
eukprot:m.50880 g.50880  ORF g.50880 m.50880 type:complete len:422 (-) comp9030_c0_seq2:643-1908(-)